MALQMDYPFPNLLDLLLQGADGLQFPLGLRSQVVGRVARFVFPLRCLGIQFGQTGIEARGQGLQFDQGWFSSEDRMRGGLMHRRPPFGRERRGKIAAAKVGHQP